mmetsp:Transcript_58357/g.139128  ORF Transcript_58357/g.139128 Transcript_58357/m.139128 type:complete len:114 (-) Transcript_58357:328-669(-)
MRPKTANGQRGKTHCPSISGAACGLSKTTLSAEFSNPHPWTWAVPSAEVCVAAQSPLLGSRKQTPSAYGLLLLHVLASMVAWLAGEAAKMPSATQISLRSVPWEELEAPAARS